MASGKVKETWPIWILIVVAIVFVVLAFKKEKPKAPEVTAQDVLADKGQASQAQEVASQSMGVPEGMIKPKHLASDQVADEAVKSRSAIVMPPQQVVPKVAFAVQVHSLKDKARADVAMEELRQKGYKAYIMVSDLGARGIWYRVRVGPFSNEEDAMKVLEAVTNEFKSGIIVSE